MYQKKNNKNTRVVVAMSGGVDSSVAAALLKDQGYSVVGIFMKLWSDNTDQADLARENVCCSVEASTAARAVANKLGIPFYVVNFADEFKELVVDNYVREYEQGRTPNPCVICNRDIKGELLIKKMEELGGDFLATGHYARIIEDNSGNPKSEFIISNQPEKSKIKKTLHFLQGKDKNKDQTYFLWTLTQEKLAHLLFPIGHLTKPEVRELAKKYNLPTAERRESQGICFIPDRDVSGFLMHSAKDLTNPGPIKNLSGETLGQHNGLVNYTIGQRERLGLGGPTAYYVVKLDKKENLLIVGDEKDLYSDRLIATDLNLISVDLNEFLTRCLTARIRYGHKLESCKVKKKGSDLEVTFDTPQRAVTPGQSIVFYDGDEVLGGAVIKESLL